MKVYSIILLFLVGLVGSTNAACDYTSTDPVVIIPSGTHNMTAGFTQLYVLTDFNGDIIAVNPTGNFGTQNFGTYNIYAVNYEDASGATVPVVGVNISALNTGCIDLSPALPITVCETSVDSVCEDSGNDIVLAMNPDFNFASDYNQVMVIVDNVTGNIVSVKVLDLLTGMVSYTTTAVTGELTLGDYTAYAVNYQNPETLTTLGLTIGASWTGVFGAACADASGGDLIQVDQCCGANVGNLNAFTTGNTTNNGAPINEFILCDGDNFLVDTISGYSAATGANPALDYAIYICAPTPGVEPDNDPCFSGAYIETPPSVNENNNGGINSNIISYLNGIGQTLTNNTVWIVPQTLSVSALGANQYDPNCYDLGTPYKVTYLNPITTSEVTDCSASTLTVTVNGGYPEFFTGAYNLTNTGSGTLSATTIASNGGSVTISGLTNGDNYSFTILDDNNCPLNFSGTYTCFECGTCITPDCLIAGDYPDYATAAAGPNHCSQINDMTANAVSGGTFTSYHSLTSSPTGTVGIVISVGVNALVCGTPCPVTRVATLYPVGGPCTVATGIVPSTTTANGSPFYNPEFVGLTPNTNYVLEVVFTVPVDCEMVDHCESYYFPSCPADVGNIAVTGSGTLVGANEYDLTDCQTITFTASNEDLNAGALVYGWAIFSCEPTLPFTAAEILDLNNHPCYLGQSTGLSTSDTDAGGISGGIPGGFDTLYVVPYTSEALLSGSLDNNGDGCYDYGDVYQINYIAPSCGDCAAPTCAIGSVPEFANRSYLQCDDPCADLNDLTHVTYHTVTTDAFGNVGVVQQLSFDQILCSGITRTAVLRDAASACTAVDILPTTLNANAVGSGFNPEWIGLTPNTNYTLIVTTVIGSNCNYDYGCIDFYGIPQCVVDVGNTSAVTTDNTNNDYVLCFNEAIDLSTTGYTLPTDPSAPTIGYALYNCLPTTNDPATDPCFTGQYVVGDAVNSVNDGTFAPALAAVNQTVWLVPITMDTAVAPIFDHDFDGDGCFDMGTPIEITYLNDIATIVTQNCGAGEITVQISGGYPEFFNGNYNITNNGAGTLDSVTLSTNNGIVTLSGLTNGMAYDLAIVDDNACTITNVTGTYVSAIIDSVPYINAGCNNNDGQLEVFVSNTVGNVDYSVNGTVQTNNSLFTGLSADNYLVQITDDNGCIDSLNITISAALLITYDADSVDALCFGDGNGSITFSNAAGGDGTYNYSIDNGVTTQVSPVFNSLGAATYQLVVADNSGCSSSSTITINEPNAITFDVDSVDVLCFGDGNGSITFSNAAGGDGTYNYSIDNGGSTQTSPLFTNLGPAGYQLIVTDNTGCSLDSSITINEPAAITFDVDSVDVLCFGNTNGSITFSNAAGGDGIYNYSIDNGVTTQTSPIFSTLGAAVYQLTVTDNSGCSLDSSIAINEPAAITFDVDSVDALCFGNINGSITFSNAAGGDGVYNYSIDNGVTTQASPIFNTLGEATYQLTVADNSGCSLDSSIAINEPAAITFNVDTVDVLCFGDVDGSITFSNAAGGDGIYNYSIDNGVTTQISPIFNTLGAATYPLTVVDNSGCLLDSTITINEPTTLTIDNLAIVDPTCNGATDGVVTATISGGTPNYSYAWSGALAGVNDNQATNVGQGTYSLTVTDLNGCSVDTLNFVVNEPAPITVTTITSTDVLCADSCNGTITVVSPNATLFGIDGATTTASNQFLNLCAGAYTLELFDANGCRFDTTAAIGTPLPVVVTANLGQTICIGQNLNLGANATGGDGTYTFNWTWDLTAGVGQNLNVSPTVTTAYTVNVIDGNGCPSNADIETILVNDPLTVQAFSDTMICLGNSADISAIATGGDGNYTYSWNTGALIGTPLNVSPTTTAVYTVTLTDGCGTPAVNDNVTVMVRNLPDATFVGGGTDCGAVTVNFVANDANNPLYNNNASFVWDFGNGSIASSRDGVSNTFSSPGTYDVTYTITDSLGCVGTATILNAVEVYEVPVADFSYYPEVVDLLNPQVEFTDESIGSNLTHAWTFESNVTPAASTELNPVINFPGEESGNYTVCLTVETANGCPSNTCQEVVIGGVLFFYIPNAFTPDLDGLNETFKPSIFGADIEDYTFMIFDRWGELLFESQNLTSGWDGHYRSSELVKDDVYVWKVKFYDPTTAKVINKAGHVTLIK